MVAALSTMPQPSKMFLTSYTLIKRLTEENHNLKNEDDLLRGKLFLAIKKLV